MRLEPSNCNYYKVMPPILTAILCLQEKVSKSPLLRRLMCVAFFGITCGIFIYTLQFTLPNPLLLNYVGDSIGGGLFNVDNPGKTTLNVKASLVATNTSGNCAGTITDQGFNLDSANTCGFSNANHDLVNTDPQLGALADNGGPTQTQALASTSPAIEQVPAAMCPTTDQRGVSRSHSNEACDMGAF